MGGGNCYLDSNKPLTKSLSQGNGLSFDSPSLALGWRRGWVQSPKFYFILGIIFNLCLLGFFKYTDFLLENFNAFSQIAHLDFNIPLPHILLPLALSFVTFQQIAFLFDCYKHATGQSNENLHIDFIDYALFISFFPQLIAGPIVHHREMMPQFAKMGNSSLARPSRELEKFSFDRQPALSQSNFSAQPTNLTQDTRIANDLRDSNNPSLRDLQSKSWQSAGFVSKAKQPSKHSPSQTPPASGGLSFDSPSLALGWRSGWVDSTQKSTINYEFLAKGIFIFSIGLFKKVFIADSFAKWANAGFSVVEKGGYLNIAESWATSLSYTFQLYFDFSGYCDMAIGLGLMFGIVLPLNFNSPYKSLNIAEFWRRWHITLGRFLKECLYIPLGGNRGKPIFRKKSGRILDEKSGLCSCEQGNRTDSSLTKRTTNLPDLSPKANATTLRNLFIVAFLSGIWHGAGWGFVIWGILHGVAMVVHRIYSWFIDSLNANISSLRADEIGVAIHKNKIIDCHANAHNDSTYTMRFLAFTQSKIYKILAWLIIFNFINIAWIFFRAENLSGAVNLLKGMFGIESSVIPHKWSRIFSEIHAQTNEMIIWLACAFIVCLACRNSFEMLKKFDTKILCFKLALRIFNTRLYLKVARCLCDFVLTLALFYASVWAMIANVLDSNAYTPFLYFNF